MTVHNARQCSCHSGRAIALIQIDEAKVNTLQRGAKVFEVPEKLYDILLTITCIATFDMP